MAQFISIQFNVVQGAIGIVGTSRMSRDNGITDGEWCGKSKIYHNNEAFRRVEGGDTILYMYVCVCVYEWYLHCSVYCYFFKLLYYVFFFSLFMCFLIFLV